MAIRQVMASAQSRVRNISEAFKYLADIQEEVEDLLTMVRVLSSTTVLDFKDLELDTDSLNVFRQKNAKIGRSLNTSIPGIQIDAKTAKQLKTYFERSKDLSKKLSEVKLRTAEWKTEFTQNPVDLEKLLKVADTTIKGLESALNEQRKWLSNLAKGKKPAEFSKLTNRIFNKLVKVLTGRYEESERRTQMWLGNGSDEGGDDGTIYITDTLRLTNFVHDNGGIEPKYYINVTLKWDPVKKEASTHVVTHDEYAHPGTYDIGDSFSSDTGAMKVIQELMALDAHDVTLHDTNIPRIMEDRLDGLAKTIGERGKLVDSIRLSDDRHYIEVRTKKWQSNDALEGIVHSIMANFPPAMRIGKIKVSKKAECVITITTDGKESKRKNKPSLEDSDLVVYENPSDHVWVAEVEDEDNTKLTAQVAKILKEARNSREGFGSKIERTPAYNLVRFYVSPKGTESLQEYKELVRNMRERGFPEAKIRSVRRALGV